MNRVISISMALTLAVLVQASAANAQERWGVELRTNFAIATQDEARDTSEKGVGFEGSVQYRFLPHLAAYAGWDWNYFPALEDIAGPDMEIIETGYVAGLRFEHPFSEGSGTAGWVRVGATVKHLELENEEGDLVDDSGHGLGWEAGAGVAMPLGERWMLTPGIRYSSLSRDLEIESVTKPVSLQSLAFELGVGFRF